MASEIQFHELTTILKRRKRLILSMAFMGGVLGGLGALLLPQRYTAKAQIIFEPQYTSRPGGPTQLISTAAEDAAIATQVTTLLSHGHEETVRSSLLNDPEFLAAFAAETARKAATQAAIRGELDSIWTIIQPWLPWTAPETADPVPEAADAGGAAKDLPPIPTAREFQTHLRAFQEAGSHVIAVFYSAESPEVAAAIANRTVKAYLQSEGDRKRATASREINWLGARIPAMKAQLQRVDKEIQDYGVEHGLNGIAASSATDATFAELGVKLAVAENDVAARKARLTYLQGLRSGGSDTGAYLEYLNSPSLVDLNHQHSALQQTEAELGSTVGPQHPALVQIHNKLRDLQRKISLEADRAIRNLENDAQIAGILAATLRTRLNVLQQAGTDAHLQDLRHEVTIKRQLFSTLLQHQEELAGQESEPGPDVRVLSLASPPDRASSPAAVLFVVPGVIVFLVGGCLIAVLATRLDMRMRNQRDIRETLGLPCLAAIPMLQRVRKQRPHQTLLAKPLGAYAEAIRSLVASLRLTDIQDAPKLVLVTSSLPGEGKTTVAVSLATYVASLGRRVLLVDLDFRRASAQRELGRETGAGVLDLLLHERPASEVIQHLDDLKLDYLPVSRRPADPFALFASNQMRQLLNQLRDRYDCVIVDGPPLLVITEARLLATMVDKVLLVVKWGSTRRETAQNALDLLHGAEPHDALRGSPVIGGTQPALRAGKQVDVAGAVLSQVDASKHAQGRYGDTAAASRKYRRLYIGAD